MKRREFIRRSSTGLLSTLWVTQACRGPQPQQPNIIFLLTDDQRWDTLGCMGNPLIQTPHLDHLAEQGVLFNNAFVTTSICMTSRASILLGQYLRRHQINDFNTNMTDEQLSQTYPLLLKQAGYRIGFIGKYGVGNQLPEQHFDYWRGIPGQPMYEQKDEEGNDLHLTRMMGNQALEFLKASSADQPFCLSVSFKAPHVQDNDPRQFIYDPAFKHLYQDVNIPPSKTANSAYYERLPDFLKDDQTTARIRWHKRFATPESYQEMVKGYYRLITGVDVVVGKIRQTLQKQHLADNTVIIFVGDNGFFLGEHGFAGKWYGYEESIRVPLLIYDPRLPQSKRGQKREEMALNIDIMPTILGLAGVPIPSQVQGQNLLPLVNGDKPEWRHDFLYEHLFVIPEKAAKGGTGNIPSTEGVVTQRFKYLRYIEQHPVYEELFDLENDPRETQNLAGKVEFREPLLKLRLRCDQLIRETR